MRPALTLDISADEFDSYYWYRSELADFAHLLGISNAGGKFEIHDRISEFLRTGKERKKVSFKSTSNFSWQSEELTLETVITDNYKNCEHVRKFFKKHCGEQFKFSIDFMNFMKASVGLKLQDAVEYYHHLQALRKAGIKQVIPDHNQFNQFVVDFIEDNPTKSSRDATDLWLQIIEEKRPGCRGRGFIYQPHNNE